MAKEPRIRVSHLLLQVGDTLDDLDDGLREDIVNEFTDRCLKHVVRGKKFIDIVLPGPQTDSLVIGLRELLKPSTVYTLQVDIVTIFKEVVNEFKE